MDGALDGFGMWEMIMMFLVVLLLFSAKRGRPGSFWR